MQELLALSELVAQMVRALTQGVCRADVRPLLGVFTSKVNNTTISSLYYYVSSHESTMSGEIV